MNRLNQTCFILLCTAITFSYGCGSKSISLKPDITYGNPSYKHVKDLPQVKYKDSNEFINKPKEGDTLTAEEHERLGDAFLAGKEYFLAFMQYEKSLDKNNNNTLVQYKKGLTFLGSGKKEEAQNQFELVISKNPDFALAYEGIGRLHLIRKNYYLASIKFQKAISLDPLLWRSYNYLGNSYFSQGKVEQAIKEFKTALTIRPKAGFILNNLGLAQYSLKLNREAVKSYYAALNSGFTKRKVYNNLGIVLLDMELYDDALKAFIQGSDRAIAYNNMGVGYMNHGKIKTAVEYFKKAIDMSPTFYVTANENLKKCQKIITRQ